MIGFLRQASAQALDVELMRTPGFSLDQLMELAGLSVACAVAKVFPLERIGGKLLLAIAGPGNNGGDALVAARHLVHFGYGDSLRVVYPKMPSTPALFAGLVAQLEDLGVPVASEMPSPLEEDQYGLILDGVFGFSFSATSAVRKPFDTVLQTLRDTQIPIASIDIPSGWDVEKGDVNGVGVRTPELLISLTAPKLCAQHYKGVHYLGGRFLPRRMAEKYNLTNLPAYPGVEQCVEWKMLESNNDACEPSAPSL